MMEGQYFDSRRYCLGLFEKNGKVKDERERKNEKYFMTTSLSQQEITTAL